MTKAAGAACNLDCTYCYYLEKEALYETRGRTRMSMETLEVFVRDYIRSQPTNLVTFAWQGGEPTLMGIDFYREAVRLQQLYSDGREIENAFQTNGTRLDDAWCEFFSKNGFLVGISIDGPKEIHDAYRLGRSGRGSFDEVMRGLRLLQKHGVSYNTLTTVHHANEDRGREVYKFLKKCGSRYLQFIPIIEREAGPCARQAGLKLASPDDPESAVMPWSVSSTGFGRFLKDVFDVWIKRDVGKVFVQHFDGALASWLGIGGGACVFAETCGHNLAIEHDGSIYACDHYVYPEYRVGHVGEAPLASIIDQPSQRAFGKAKKDSLPKACHECAYLFACNGDCPKHRFVRLPDETHPQSYLCRSLKSFFKHIDPAMRTMAEDWRRRNGTPQGALKP
ncbi:MAG: anaerobic sulfatase maturase [Puniceicoccaceae bacterium]|nr:MAG: anaerobic sulfatase maturase [Puniceicoccaceae bacterium]